VSLVTHDQQARLTIVMGVSGCGKSTVGAALAKHLNVLYLEGDDFHPPENKEKMSSGVALNDDDRWPWLQLLSQTMKESAGETIVSCSSLKRSYRNFIIDNVKEPVLFVCLTGNRDVLEKRLSSRTGHFMSSALLDSQLATLELPEKDELSIMVDIDASIDEVVEEITRVTSFSK